MIDVISVKFKNRGKCYFFSPNGLDVQAGTKVVVETSKGLELADCVSGVHAVEDSAVIQPLRPVVRIATADDRRVDEINRSREKEAFTICQQQIEEHGLDMKLVDVECNFEGNKTTFFFTSDGRVDFRDLVKDLAGIFRNRIELRQIGVRDEAKMLGGIGICGRPYCCSQFLDDFQPVSTKMAKTQSLSLNPAKISGSCGRLMCCLRYEQEAYEELVKKVPKQGAFVQTKDGYGTAVQVNLLRQTVKVKLDDEGDENLHLYKSNELAAVPGGRPKDGEPVPDVFTYVPEEENEEKLDEWADISAVQEETAEPVENQTAQDKEHSRNRRRRNNRGKKRGSGQNQAKSGEEKPAQDTRDVKHVKVKETNTAPEVKNKKNGGADSGRHEKPSGPKEQKQQPGSAAVKPKKKNNKRKFYHNKNKAKPKAE